MIKINFTYFYISVCESENVSCSVMSDSLSPYGLQPARLLCPWDSPGKNPGVGCHFAGVQFRRGRSQWDQSKVFQK